MTIRARPRPRWPAEQAEQDDDGADGDHHDRPAVAEVDRRLAGPEQRLEEPPPDDEQAERDCAQAKAGPDEGAIAGSEAVQHEADPRGSRDQGPGIGPGVPAVCLVHGQQQQADGGHDGPGDREAQRRGPVGQQTRREQQDTRNDHEQRPAAAAQPGTRVEICVRHRQRHETDDDEGAADDEPVTVRAPSDSEGDAVRGSRRGDRRGHHWFSIDVAGSQSSMHGEQSCRFRLRFR